jgi:hypothetical protein
LQLLEKRSGGKLGDAGIFYDDFFLGGLGELLRVLGKFDSLKENFESLKRKILTV